MSVTDKPLTMNDHRVRRAYSILILGGTGREVFGVDF
jgi:hypothetical protein